MTRAGTHHISLSAAHPAKFSEVAILALKDNAGFNFEEQVLPDELKALSQKATRVTKVDIIHGRRWGRLSKVLPRRDLKAEASDWLKLSLFFAGDFEYKSHSLIIKLGCI